MDVYRTWKKLKEMVDARAKFATSASASEQSLLVAFWLDYIHFHASVGRLSWAPTIVKFKGRAGQPMYNPDSQRRALQAIKRELEIGVTGHIASQDLLHACCLG